MRTQHYGACLLIGLAMTSLTHAADNKTYICQHPQGEERKIEILYSQGTEVPCEVLYHKTSGTQVLWNAANTLGYCEEKAVAFVQKQEGWGYDCTLTNTSESVTEETAAASAAASANTEASVETPELSLSPDTE